MNTEKPSSRVLAARKLVKASDLVNQVAAIITVLAVIVGIFYTVLAFIPGCEGGGSSCYDKTLVSFPTFAPLAVMMFLTAAAVYAIAEYATWTGKLRAAEVLPEGEVTVEE